jgi:hypothetical protein
LGLRLRDDRSTARIPDRHHRGSDEAKSYQSS